MRKKQLLLGGGLLILVLIPVALVWGFNPPTTNHPTENVANTKHNLSLNQDIVGSPIPATANVEICVFCHTPHGANPGASGAAPLWNRALPPTLSFQEYKSPNFDAKGTDPGKPKGVSLACLSCHDGTIAFDALINAPGSGGFTPNNRTTTEGPGTPIFGFGAFAGAIVDPGTNTFTSSVRSGQGTNADGSPYTGGLDDFVSSGGPAGSAGSTPFPNLQRNLEDDHPISMAIPILDPQFDQVRAGAMGDGKIWKLKREGGTGESAISQDFSTDKRDVVRAYPNAAEGDPTQGGPITANIAYVECASCHNPHTPRPSFLRIPSVDTSPGKQTIPTVSIPNKKGVVVGDTNTLDGYPNAGSLLCLTCHQK